MRPTEAGSSRLQDALILDRWSGRQETETEVSKAPENAENPCIDYPYGPTDLPHKPAPHGALRGHYGSFEGTA